jgi:hypothetical protein
MDAELLIERDRRLVAVVSLNVDDGGAAQARDPAEMPDEGGRDPPAAMLPGGLPGTCLVL